MAIHHCTVQGSLSKGAGLTGTEEVAARAVAGFAQVYILKSLLLTFILVCPQLWYTYCW